ncbi:hypothetical protein GETHLI_33740 [Geothrix limicola]|uniref:Shikimate kinase n=1 Tax=Geothrix limicola TaxID=2927978 RepID=A0ABQ5QIZ8_9BACT|nr:hypothetical protein [Geothrix limicola]GLH74872.1 hypothetical protein GETHLI_33740 [Geothrix limicola]
MRIAILGNSGSGKSTLARRIAARYGVEPLDLDGFAWEPGKIAVPRDPAAALNDVETFCTHHPEWVIEGCYANLIAATLKASPLLLFLEPGVEVCLSHCRNRPWEPHKYASKADQDEKLAFLLDWVRDYYVREGDLSLDAHQTLFKNYGGPKQMVREPVGPSFIEALAAHRTEPS